jgi:hypothetical protein
MHLTIAVGVASFVLQNSKTEQTSQYSEKYVDATKKCLLTLNL